MKDRLNLKTFIQEKSNFAVSKSNISRVPNKQRGDLIVFLDGCGKPFLDIKQSGEI